MKTIIFLIITLFTSMNTLAQIDQKTEVRKTIEAFSQATALHDVETLERLLEPNYRVVMNQLFGNTSTLILDRATYLSKIEKKEFGGIERSLEFHAIDVNGKTASVKVSLIGNQSTFTSYFNLIKNTEEEWKIVSDLPTIE